MTENQILEICKKLNALRDTRAKLNDEILQLTQNLADIGYIPSFSAGEVHLVEYKKVSERDYDLSDVAFDTSSYVQDVLKCKYSKD